MRHQILISLFLLPLICCGDKTTIYEIPYSYIISAFQNIDTFNHPFQVTRQRLSDKVAITVKNRGPGIDTESTQKANIQNGAPTSGIYLYDSTQMIIIIKKQSYKATKPILKDEAPITRNARLDLKGVPDGLYHLVIVDVNSEFPLEIKVKISTVK